MAGEPKKLTIFDVQAKVAAGEKVFQVTATDFPTELSRFTALGIQGLFADHPDQAVTALRRPALKV